MIVKKVLNAVHIRSDATYLYVGSIASALLISLGMVGVLALVDFQLNPAIPAALGAMGAALFAARAKLQRSR